jgi:hypothetical protein
MSEKEKTNWPPCYVNVDQDCPPECPLREGLSDPAASDATRETGLQLRTYKRVIRGRSGREKKRYSENAKEVLSIVGKKGECILGE